METRKAVALSFMTFRFLSVMALGLLCAGCLKLEHDITSPGARGIVLDARTRSPVSGAEVVISRTQFWTNAPNVAEALADTRPPVITTGKSGRFRLPVEGHWHLIVDYLIEPLHISGGTLVIQRDGYEPAAIPLRGDIAFVSSTQHTNFIEVLLSPVTR